VLLERIGHARRRAGQLALLAAARIRIAFLDALSKVRKAGNRSRPMSPGSPMKMAAGRAS